MFANPPTSLPSLEQSRFYHSIDLPGSGLQVGLWDLRGKYDEYFGGHDFSGERVLDVGTASGALAFEIERRGAREVVGFDLDQDNAYDCRLPTDAGTLAEFGRWVTMVKNGFWLAHALLDSEVKMVYGHAGDLPDELGWFDTVMMGNILQHLQDPIGAVLKAVSHTNHLIITEADWLPGVGDDFPCMIMYDVSKPFSWYQVKPGLLRLILDGWGFTKQTLTWHAQVMLRDLSVDEENRGSAGDSRIPVRHYTLSARRTQR